MHDGLRIITIIIRKIHSRGNHVHLLLVRKSSKGAQWPVVETIGYIVDEKIEKATIWPDAAIKSRTLKRNVSSRLFRDHFFSLSRPRVAHEFLAK